MSTNPTVIRAGDPRAGYAPVMQAMHWVTVGLLLGAYAAAWMIDGAFSPAQRAWLLMLHRSFGVSIFLLTVMRMSIRQFTRVPKLPSDLPRAQRLAARISVILLYTLLIAQPLLGLIASLLHGDHIILFGSFVLPPLLTPNRTLAHQVFQLHGLMALSLLAQIGLHVAAALYHHIVRKDEVLVGMLPGMQRSSRYATLASVRASRLGRNGP